MTIGWREGGAPWGFQCESCLHLHSNWSTPTCAAYPEGIPTEILYNEVDHRFPLPGDHGIQFEPDEGEESPFAYAERRAAELADEEQESEGSEG
jgi:hypothetical protein